VTPVRAPALISACCQRLVPGSTPAPVHLAGLSPLTSSRALEVRETSADMGFSVADAYILRTELLVANNAS